MANLACAVGPAPHFTAQIRCVPFAGQTVHPTIELAAPADTPNIVELTRRFETVEEALRRIEQALAAKP
jgi:hypothetical protein